MARLVRVGVGSKVGSQRHSGEDAGVVIKGASKVEVSPEEEEEEEK